MERETRMMSVKTIYDIVANMKEQLHVELSHPYVKKYIHHPRIDENRLLYMCSFLDTLSMEEEKKNSSVLSVMLVQTALDTHDLVSTQNVSGNEGKLHERQLVVLAGDYYSGLYYYYLAQSSQLNLMKVIASAIKEINIAKIHIYNNRSTNPHDVMNSFLAAESSFVRCLCDYFEREEWKELLKHAAYLNGILKQLKSLQHKEPTLLLNYCKQIGMNQEQIKEYLYSYTQQSVNIVRGYLRNEFAMNEFLREHLDELTSSLEVLKNVVGEG